MHLRPISLILLIGILSILGWGVFDAARQVLSPLSLSYGSLTLRDRSGIIITSKGLSDGIQFPYEGSLSGKLIDAIIAVEDKRYLEHSGVDLWGKFGGIRENIAAGEIVRGSSTITEQYVKNAYYRGDDRTFLQKIREAIGAVTLETQSSKEDILRSYLDNIYFGNRIYGLETLLRISYPGKVPETLSEGEILDIITRIHSPNISPQNLERAQKYRTRVARKLSWQDTPDGLSREISPKTLDQYPLITARVQRAITDFCQGKQETLIEWTKNIPEGLCREGSQDLTLSIDLGLMYMADAAIDQNIATLQKENVTNAAVYIYNPSEKKILAYIGSRAKNTNTSAVDMITTRRSVGSLLKPWIYLLALRDGAEMEQFILDDTRIYPTGVGDQSFIPINYSPKSYGPIRLREALGNSLNSAAVRLSETLGISRIHHFLKENGLELDHDAGYYGYGIALGNIELTLENIVHAGAGLINMNDGDLFLLQEALANPRNRSAAFGISSILNSTLSLPVKTGTSTDFRDNWALSYHPDAVIGVWVGNADGSPMQDVSGVSGAGPLWHTIAEYMSTHGYIRPWSRTPPAGIHRVSICLDQYCRRQIQTYMKSPRTLQSRSDENHYFLEDFIGIVTPEEQEKWNIE